MNIILPLGDARSTMLGSDHRFPKPLLNVLGKPRISWLLDNLDAAEDDVFFVVLEKQLDEQYCISRSIAHAHPLLTIKVVHVLFETRGPAESVLCALNGMDEAVLQRRTVCIDSETVYFCGVLQEIRILENDVGAVVFTDSQVESAARFSYVETSDESGVELVTNISEKVLISGHANLGLYAFPSGSLLMSYILKACEVSSLNQNDYYLSRAISLMLTDTVEIRSLPLPVKSYGRLSSSNDVDAFADLLAERPHLVETRSFCFDFDNTLVSYPVVAGDYSTVTPIERNVKYVRHLHQLGHRIIIATARRMKTHNGNVGLVVADIGDVTLKTLRKFNIPFHEIVFGKPYAHLYVLKGSVHSLVNPGVDLGLVSEPLNADNSNFIAARAFNDVVRHGETVIKTSRSSALDGEIFFYQNIPASLAHLFPAFLHSNSDGDRRTLKIGLVDGVTASHLFLARCLTAGRLRSMLECLSELHGASDVNKVACAHEHVNIFENYGPKISKRYEDHMKLYAALGISSGDVETVTARLGEYVTSSRSQPVRVVHGDPVFTNLLSTRNGDWKFIDMRGAQGTSRCLNGDAVYDLAKVYQSLSGYDFILADSSDLGDLVNQVYISTLRKTFRAFVLDAYKRVSMADIALVTSSLYLSLIPLHENLDHQSKFADAFRRLLAESESLE
jgi:capsule biosynthesis phosphatase